MRKIKRFLSAILVIMMLFSMVVIQASAITIATKPNDGTTSGAPFPKGTGGSNSFRIPAMVTLSNGTVVAAADARWNTTYDGGGLDTIVSRSYDNGASWKYTFANYLGDNGNVYSGSGSTAFIDPALAVTKDDTIYMLVDIYPYGIALNGSGNTAPTTMKGFDNYGRLLLSSNNHSSYNYYLENGKIYSTSGTAVSGYTVDEYFNIVGTNGTSTNLFFSDSPYKVVRTGFLYLTKSTDGGASWSAPQLLNLKTTSEMVCLIAPGRGLVTQSGTIVFPVYSYHGDNSPSSNTQRLSFIYSTDGVNWSRTSEFNYNWASESAVVELEDGTLRFFFRNGTTNLCYVDYNMNSLSWGSAVNTGLDTNSNCQISAITYSRKSNGKQVILVSCPTGPNEAGSNQSGASYRLNGKIFVGLVNENKTMSWQNSISVTSNNSQFMYSCLTELNDGSVAILYENLENGWGTGSSCYYTMGYKEYDASALGVSFECAHTYTSETTEATCIDAGYTTYTCSQCGDSYKEEIAAVGHQNESVSVDATCEEDGSVTTTCTVCGESTVEVIEAKGHDYECVVTDATCGKEGSEVYTCAVCGSTYTETVPATGNHKYETVTVAATCTENGSVTDTCTVCGHSQMEVIAAIGHKYNSSVTAATCTEEGYTTYSCAACGHSYTDSYTNALGHTYDTTVSATCTEAGYVVYTCETCGHSYNGETIAALGHSYEATVVAPTCANDGYTTYVCATCGDTYTGNAVAALGHSYQSSVTVPTCTEPGFTTFLCTVCGHTYTGNEVAALGHEYDSVVTDPTFETEGYTTHTCRVCGNVKVDTFVPVLSHTYETTTVEPSCTVDGTVTHTCVDCGYTYTEVLPAAGHFYETVTVEASCTVNGSVVSTCADCGDVHTEVIPAKGHSYETVRIAPTCTETGYITYTCACGDVVTETIPATGHSYQSSYIAPTCTETGSTTYTCACGDVLTDVVPALGHSYESKSVAPTCTAGGYTTYTCATCGDSYIGDETAALGHSYESVTTAPTCTAGGYTTYTCVTCGYGYTGNTTAALGHNNTAVVTAPTCTAGGYTTYTCVTCGYSYTGNTTAALGHDYTCVESNGYLVYTCRCGDSYSEKIENLTYTKVSSASSGNSYVITMYSGRKYYALSHKNNTISAVQVTVSNNQITSEITDDLVWDYSNKKLSYQDGNTTYNLYAQTSSSWWGFSSNATLKVSSTNSSSVTFSNSRLKIGSYYLRYNNGSATLNRSSGTTYFFVES